MNRPELFRPITDADWARELKRARSERNCISDQIKMKLHPQNPTPGHIEDMPPAKPMEQVTNKEIVELLYLFTQVYQDAALDNTRFGRKTFEMLKEKLNDLRSRT